MRSSYKLNDLGEIIYDFVLERCPLKVIEFGVLDGYSTVWIARALKNVSCIAHLWSYDLWDNYEFKHGNKREVEKRLIAHEVNEVVTLGTKDFYEFLEDPESFDLLHLDISNDGDIIEQAIEKCMKFIVEDGAAILFEGGSEERDREDWMMEFHRRPINDIKFSYRILSKDWPSISMVDREVLYATTKMRK